MRTLTLVWLAACGSPAAPPPPALEPVAEAAPAPVAAAQPPAAPAPVAAGPSHPAATGEVAPPLSLPEVDGGTWTLAEHLDPAGETSPKGFLVAYMASWCGYCELSLPTLAALEKSHPDLLVVTVTTDDTPVKQKLEASKVRKAGITGPVLVADKQTALVWIGDGAVPRYFFVDHNGVITNRDLGFGDQVRELMPHQADKALRD